MDRKEGGVLSGVLQGDMGLSQEEGVLVKAHCLCDSNAFLYVNLVTFLPTETLLRTELSPFG